MFWKGSTAIEGLSGSDSGEASTGGSGGMAGTRTRYTRTGRAIFLTCCLSHVFEGVIEPVPDLIADDTADTDPTGLHQGFEPGGDIHTIAENVVLLDDHIAEI